jgi:acetolactate synthase-1/2/3 large subunit
MSRIDGGELLARALRAEGVGVVVSISDISHSTLLRSTEAMGIRHIGPRHESAGVHIAEGWGRVRGDLAVVFGAAGPGVANMVPGVMCAAVEGRPLLAIGMQRVRRSMHAVRRGRFQSGPQLEVMGPITKFAAAVEEVGRIPEFVREAARQALTGRPGPSYLEIPADLLVEMVEEDTIAHHRPERSRGAPAAPDPALARDAVDLLGSAALPVILAGNGVHHAGASAELLALAEQLGAPVMTTLGARGAISEDHPLCLGPVMPIGGGAQHEADVVLAVGTQLGETVGYLMPPQWAGPERQQLIHLDADPSQLGVNRLADLAIVADARAGLAALHAEAAGRGPARSPAPAAQAHLDGARALRDALTAGLADVPGPSIHPGRLAVEVMARIPEDGIVCLDGGNTGIWAHLSMRVRRPRSFLWTSHYGHLGTGLPYALGAKIAAPQRPVVLISGDGAFGFNLAELETAAREGLAVVVVISCDDAWGMEDVYMEKVAGTTVGVALSSVRYDQVATALGCHGEHVRDLDGLSGALDRAFAAGRPAVVQVAVDPAANRYPPGLDEFAGMYEAEST